MAARKFVRDDVDKFFEYGIDISSRTIVLSGYEIDSSEAEAIIIALHILDRTNGDIVIKLNSPGGDFYSGLAIYDAISECTNKVRIIGYGQVMSMGAVIFQAGDERILMPHATMLIHYGSDWFTGHTKDLERRGEESKRGSTVMEDIFLARIQEKLPEYTRKDFKEQFSFDTFLAPEQAVAMGLADRIYEP